MSVRIKRVKDWLSLRAKALCENQPNGLLGVGGETDRQRAASVKTNHCSAGLRSGMWIATVATLPRNDEKNTRNPDRRADGRPRSDEFKRDIFPGVAGLTRSAK